MEYLPYKIDEGSHRIEIFLNKFHGLLTFSNLEEGQEYLQNQLVKRIKWEESGKNAQNCIYSADQISQESHNVKEGLFGEELEDGFLLKKKVTGYFGSIYVTNVCYYLLSPFSRPMRTPSITPQEQEKSQNKPGFSNVVAELKSKFANKEKEILKSTGLMEDLVNPKEEEATLSEEMYLESHDFDQTDILQFEDCPLPPLSPLPAMYSPIRIRNFNMIQDIITQANAENQQVVEEVNKEFSSDIEEESESESEESESESEESESESEESESESEESESESEESESESEESDSESEESDSESEVEVEEVEESEDSDIEVEVEEVEESEESDSESEDSDSESEDSDSESEESDSESEESDSESDESDIEVEVEEVEETGNIIFKTKRVDLVDIINRLELDLDQIELEGKIVDLKLEQNREKRRIVQDQQETLLLEESESTFYDSTEEEEESSTEEGIILHSTGEVFTSEDSDGSFWYESSSSESGDHFLTYSL